MGPVFESILLILLIAALALGGLGYALRDPLRRLWTYLTLWWERDKRLEEEERRQRTYRAAAEEEFKEWVHEEDEPEEPAQQQVKR